MKKLILIYFLLLSSNLAFPQYKLDIEINGIRNDTGNIMLQLFDEKENIVTQEMSPIKNKTCILAIKDLKPGMYAVRYYHDENLNGKMDVNLVGKPVEGYGFSNNVTGTFGPPPFRKWLFELNGDKRIILKPTY
jgi:uncharacterized protein (DUF2141 family)